MVIWMVIVECNVWTGFIHFFFFPSFVVRQTEFPVIDTDGILVLTVVVVLVFG